MTCHDTIMKITDEIINVLDSHEDTTYNASIHGTDNGNRTITIELVGDSK